MIIIEIFEQIPKEILEGVFTEEMLFFKLCETHFNFRRMIILISVKEKPGGINVRTPVGLNDGILGWVLERNL